MELHTTLPPRATPAGRSSRLNYILVQIPFRILFQCTADHGQALARFRIRCTHSCQSQACSGQSFCWTRSLIGTTLATLQKVGSSAEVTKIPVNKRKSFFSLWAFSLCGTCPNEQQHRAYRAHRLSICNAPCIGSVAHCCVGSVLASLHGFNAAWTQEREETSLVLAYFSFCLNKHKHCQKGSAAMRKPFKFS